jgi:hypothetical protein
LNAWGVVCGKCCFAGFRTANVHVRRVKQGTPSTHPILGEELRALRRLQREQEPKFTSERGSPFTTAGFARIIERAGKVVKRQMDQRSWHRREECAVARIGARPHERTSADTVRKIEYQILQMFRPPMPTWRKIVGLCRACGCSDRFYCCSSLSLARTPPSLRYGT